MKKQTKKNLLNHPGNLGPVRGTLPSIHHADWPAYSQGENFSEALFQLTAFPPKTGFIAVDDIDQSILFIADVPCAPVKKPFDPRNFHIAVWHSDLRKLQLEAYITGVEFCTELQWHKHQWNEMLSKSPKGAKPGFINDKGVFVALEPPDFDENEADTEYMPFVYCPEHRIQVTQAGRDFVIKSIKSNPLDIKAAISTKVAKLYELGFFDTCIREACVQLEHEIKLELGSKAWGDKLTNAFINHLQSRNKILESDIRTFQQELRSLFKLIRNDFMHNLANVDDTSALVALVRVARVRSVVQQGSGK